MNTYVMSDIHGNYDAFLEMLDKIDLRKDDKLIVNGDILDRGPKPIELLTYIMNSQNIELLCGNHELMACICLNFLLKDITDKSIKKLELNGMHCLTEWLENGGGVSLKGFLIHKKSEIINMQNYLLKRKLYKELNINNKAFVIVHGGLGNFDSKKKLNEYNINDLVWKRANYNKMYYKNKYLITGHTPTSIIEGHIGNDNIYIHKNNIAIDCGCAYGGKLGCIRLNDLKEFYVNV